MKMYFLFLEVKLLYIEFNIFFTECQLDLINYLFGYKKKICPEQYIMGQRIK